MRQSVLAATVMVASMSGCSGGSSDKPHDSSATTARPTIEKGYFKGTTVRGLAYSSGSQSGTTDIHGGFLYEKDTPVTFFVGASEGLSIGTFDAAEIITLQALPPDRRIKAMQLLMMLDEDGDPQTGITLSAALQARAMHWPRMDLYGNFSSVIARVQSDAISADGTSHPIPSAELAEAQLTAAVRCTYTGLYIGPLDSYSAMYSVEWRDLRHGSVRLIVLPPDGRVFARGETVGISGDWAPFMYIREAYPLSVAEPTVSAGFPTSPAAYSPGGRIEGHFVSENKIEGTWYIRQGDQGEWSARRAIGSPAGLYRFGALYGSVLFGAEYLQVILEIDSEDQVQMALNSDAGAFANLLGTRTGMNIEASSRSSEDTGRWTYAGHLDANRVLSGALLDTQSGRTYSFAPGQLPGCVM